MRQNFSPVPVDVGWVAGFGPPLTTNAETIPLKTFRVLLSTSTFLTQPGEAVPRFVADLAAALSSIEDLEVHVLTPHVAGAPLHERLGDLQVHRFRYFWPVRLQSLAYGHGMTGNIKSKPLASLQVLPYLGRQFSAVRRLARELRIDIVNSHWALPQGITTALAEGRSHPFRHVLTVHGGDAEVMRRLPGGGAMTRWILGRTDFLIPVSAHITNLLAESGADLPPVLVQPMGVDSSVFKPPVDGEERARQEPYLLFVGRFIPIKGVEHLLAALHELLQRGAPHRLIIVGYGPMEAELQRRCKQLGLQHLVEFVGRKPHSEVARFMRHAQALVVPSVVDRRGATEGSPTVVLEALACGTPVVGSRVGGIPGLIEEGRNGWLVDLDRQGSLSHALLQCFKADREEMSRAARSSAARHDWSQVAARYGEVFRSVTKS